MQGRNATRVPLQKSVDISDKDLERGGHRQNPSINSYLDYSGVIRDRINEGAADQNEEDEAHQVYGNTGALNPCPRHPLNEIAYLDKTSKEGACEACLPNLIQ